MTDNQTNETINTLLNRRSIRKFKTDPIDPHIRETLEKVAQRAASSNYMNDWSAIRITDRDLQGDIARIGRQPYIAQAPLLYVFIADEHRNARIAERKGIDVHGDDFAFNSSYRLIQASNDAVLALHAMETAANSLGLGCVILGSVLNDINRLIDVLHLPEYTYPVLGLAIGKPDQAPALKPRLDRSDQFFVNEYPADPDAVITGLDRFDADVHRYYDLRQADRPVDAFSDQIAQGAAKPASEKRRFTPTAERQGFRFDR